MLAARQSNGRTRTGDGGGRTASAHSARQQRQKSLGRRGFCDSPGGHLRTQARNAPAVSKRPKQPGQPQSSSLSLTFPHESTQGDTPAAAMIRASVPDAVPDGDSNPLEVEQWVDEDGDQNIDWAIVQIADLLTCFQAVPGEIGVVANRLALSSIIVTDTFRGTTPRCGETEPIFPLVRISPTCSGLHRTNTSSTLSIAVLHEARHIWQFSERLRTDLGTADSGTNLNPAVPNDSDEDFWLEEVISSFQGVDRITELFSLTGDDTMQDILDAVRAGAYDVDAEAFDDFSSAL